MSKIQRRHGHSQSIYSALKDFFAAARRLEREIVIVFLGVSVLWILSRYFGSRGFFRANFYDNLYDIPEYMLYEYLFWFICEFILYFILPLLLIRIVHKRPLTEFGTGIGDWRFGLKITAVFYLVMLPILWIVSDSPAFQAVYPHAQLVKFDWGLFLLYEAVFLLYFIGWEYIWRGYMLFGLARHLGDGVAILIQMLPFVILHGGKPAIETAGAIVAGIALGALAIRTRSFWYCVLTHWSVMLTIDLLSTLRSRAGVEGIGPGSVFDIVKHVLS